MFSVKNLTKKYKKTALDKFSIQLESGQICGLLGVNGAGKTTFMKLICGLAEKDSGEILFNDKEIVIGKYPKIGAMIESPCFFPNLSGLDNLLLLCDLSGDCNKKDALEALSFVGLEKNLHNKVKTYSLGMKQRLYLASAIMRKVDLLLLDEPFNGIDPIVLNTFEMLLKKLAKTGVSIIISSHEIRELQTLIDKAVIIDKGQKVHECDVKDDTDLMTLFLSKVNNSGNAQ